ncbi:carbonic anhydrase [Salinilacihabitans rarus]|uniref:carbonic anhydrase n=1 Tax=Salinilacihabitans rarus TaxID=2961596 RepID=UPI0020C872CF|nr:carbonic anhydrase [Salinilacihabitans rarus]
MAEETLFELLAGNAAHVDALPDDYFADVADEQRPSVVTVCCSDSRVSQEGMWNVEEPGTVFTPSNIGNQVWDAHEGERIVDGGVLYPIHHTGTETAAVVGHTGCGAVTAAYRVATGEEPPGPEGVAKWVDLLVPVVEAGLDSDLVDADADDERVVNQLVEYNVRRQAAFLRESDAVPESVAVYGFVYDLHGAYGDAPGRAYLVDHEGERDPERIADSLPEAYRGAARSLLG